MGGNQRFQRRSEHRTVVDNQYPNRTASYRHRSCRGVPITEATPLPPRHRARNGHEQTRRSLKDKASALKLARRRPRRPRRALSGPGIRSQKSDDNQNFGRLPQGFWSPPALANNGSESAV